MNRVWTENEKEYIRQNASRWTDKVLAEKLTIISGRTVTLNALRKQRRRLGITKRCGRGVCEIRTGNSM